MTVRNESSQKKWHKRVRAWIVAVVLAAVGTFITGTIVKILEEGAEKVGEPFAIVTERVKDYCLLEYVVPAGDVENIPPLPELHSTISLGEWEERRENWEREMGAIDGDTGRVRVTIAGKSELPVILQSLKIDVLGRGDPPRHAFVAGGMSACGEIVNVRYLSYNLDRHPPGLAGSVDNRNFGDDSQSSLEIRLSSHTE